MKVARFVVEVDAGWRVRVARAAGGPALVPERTMRRVTAAGAGDFPMPEAAVAAGEPHHAVCGDATGVAAARLYERVAARDPERGDVALYGRWLFDALLGEVSLGAIAAAARAEGAGLAELALRWEAGDGALGRLHWEAMRSGAGFLAAGLGAGPGAGPGAGGLRFAVTRLVAGAAHAPRPMAAPPRTLFVLGGPAGEEALRPGAELVAVLAPLRHGRRSLRGHVLAHAAPSRLRAAAGRVRPDVVHLVAHGVVESGACLLELAPDEHETSGVRSAEQVLAMLGDRAPLPVVLLLSACDSGIALPLAQAGSLAAQMVVKGVPIVIGMAGRVANVACRLFARRLGEALLAGEPLVAATEEARRAAFSEGDPPDTAIDWALPSVHLAEGVPADFATTPAPEDAIERRLAKFAELVTTPVFCGRHDVVDALHDVLGRDEHPVLAIACREEDVGRTRVLKELTAAALRAGHIPCLLLWESPGAEPPRTIERLARELGKAILRTRGVFGLDTDGDLAVSLLLDGPLGALRGDARLSKRLRGHLKLADAVDAQAFAVALGDDLAALAREARAADAASGAPSLHARSRAVVLVDDLEDWDRALEPFLGVMISTWGLGTQEEPAPVVLSFSLAAPAATLLRPVAERRDRAREWRTVQLERFGEGEDLLAYEQVLLHPFGPVLPGFSERPWVFDFEVDAEVVSESVDAFREVIAGMPAKLGDRELYVLARMGKASGFVVAARDEDVLQQIRKGGGA